MSQKVKKEPQDINLVNSIVKYATYQPLVGLCVTAITSLFIYFISKDKLWSIEMLIYMFIPFIGFSAIYFVIWLIMKIRYNIAVPFTNKTNTAVMLIAFIVIVASNVGIWNRSNQVEYRNLNISDYSSASIDIS